MGGCQETSAQPGVRQNSLICAAAPSPALSNRERAIRRLGARSPRQDPITQREDTCPRGARCAQASIVYGIRPDLAQVSHYEAAGSLVTVKASWLMSWVTGSRFA
jgi:hypothetical protein